MNGRKRKNPESVTKPTKEWQQPQLSEAMQAFFTPTATDDKYRILFRLKMIKIFSQCILREKQELEAISKLTEFNSTNFGESNNDDIINKFVHPLSKTPITNQWREFLNYFISPNIIYRFDLNRLPIIAEINKLSLEETEIISLENAKINKNKNRLLNLSYTFIETVHEQTGKVKKSKTFFNSEQPELPSTSPKAGTNKKTKKTAMFWSNKQPETPSLVLPETKQTDPVINCFEQNQPPQLPTPPKEFMHDNIHLFQTYNYPNVDNYTKTTLTLLDRQENYFTQSIKANKIL